MSARRARRADRGQLSHADEYEHPLDVRSYRQGVEDGVVAMVAEWQVAALDPTPAEREMGLTGPPVALVYCLAQELGLDGGHVLERAAAAARTAEVATA